MPVLDNAYALVIGIANYHTINALPPSVLSDAQDIRDALVDPMLCAYPPANVQLLLDGQATRAAIRQALADLAGRSKADSTVFFYLSSHGGQIETGPYAGEYLLPVDVECSSDGRIAQTAISGADFTQALRRIPARKVVVIFDCCHAGGIGQPKAAQAPVMKALPESYYEALKQGQGRVILASSRSSEVSWVRPGARNSLFTQHLLAGLRGGAPGTDGLIRIFDLFAYLQPRVTAEQANQHPIFKAELEENFAIALYPGVGRQREEGAAVADVHDLRKRLIEYASLSDVQDICFMMESIDQDNYPPTKGEFIRELLRDLQRQRRVGEFVALLRQEKPWVME